MSWRHTKAAGELALRNPTQKAVLLAISHHANEYTGQCWPSVMRLALFTGLSERAVQQAITGLTEGQFLIVTPTPGRPNRYTMTLEDAPPFDQLQGGAGSAPLNQRGGAGSAPGGAGSAPEHLKNKEDSTRAQLVDDWQPDRATILAIKTKHPELGDDDIEAEREMFVLKNLANGTVVHNANAAFRAWIGRRGGLMHPPPAPRSKKAGQAPLGREEMEERMNRYRRRGEALPKDDPMRPKFLGWAEDLRIELARMPPPLFEEKNP